MNKLKSAIKNLWDEKPLTLILGLALLLRLTAATFSMGYGWHDDHFLTVEPPHSWVMGNDYNNWLPSSNNNEFKPSGHSFTYTGIMYGIFWLMEHSGLSDPQGQMFLVRLLHALFSLLIVYYGFRIAEKLYGKDVAKSVGLLLAVLYFMPFLSVRNLVEFVCIPFLMGGLWFLLTDKPGKWKWLVLSGFFFAMAFSIRYQNMLFIGGVGAVLLFKRPFLQTAVWGLAVLSVVCLTQGLVDYLIWGVPFAEFWEYFTYNQSAGATDYFVREWYMYIVLLLGMFIPPISLFLISGFISDFRKHLLIAVPVLLFFAFHSWFPNKQERFILPIIPFIIILGYGGWCCLQEVRFQTPGWKKFIRASWIFFWVLNIIAIVPLTVMYSKKSRVETMSYLGKQPDYVSYIIEDSQHSNITMLPDFYSGKSYSSWRIMSDIDIEWVQEQVLYLPVEERPNYMLFMYRDNLQGRIDYARVFFKLELMIEVEPSFMDGFLHWLNPNNRNESIVIYRINWDKQK